MFIKILIVQPPTFPSSVLAHCRSQVKCKSWIYYIYFHIKMMRFWCIIIYLTLENMWVSPIIIGFVIKTGFSIIKICFQFKSYGFELKGYFYYQKNWLNFHGIFKGIYFEQPLLKTNPNITPKLNYANFCLFNCSSR